MLIGIDLQNHGKSDHREISETFEQDAKDIAAVLDKLNIEKPHFWFQQWCNKYYENCRTLPGKGLQNNCCFRTL